MKKKKKKMDDRWLPPTKKAHVTRAKWGIKQAELNLLRPLDLQI